MFDKFFKKEQAGSKKPTPSDKNHPLTPILAPDVDPSHTFRVLKWLVEEGDYIQNGSLLAELETQKATMELVSYTDGFVLYLAVQEGEIMEAKTLMAIVGNQGADINPVLNDFTNTETGTPLDVQLQLMEGYIGEVKMFAGENPPRSWMFCDGALLKIKEYPDLFKVTQGKYGKEDDIFFRLPKLLPQNGVNYIICVEGKKAW